jgi:hypothetical protein
VDRTVEEGKEEGRGREASEEGRDRKEWRGKVVPHVRKFQLPPLLETLTLPISNRMN